MENLIDSVDSQELPWLIFTLCNNAYAINSKYVNGILMPPEVTPLPEAEDIYKGLIDIRGEVFPLLEVRKLFHFKSIDGECNEFKEFMDKLKEAHISWVGKLKECVEKNNKSLIETDPTKCAFGKWYYDYIKSIKADTAALRNLQKIEQPHRLLHETGAVIFKLIDENTDGKNDIQIKKHLNTALENYMPIIIGLMDEAAQTFRSQYRETVVQLSNGSASLGLLVDEVLAIDKITMVSDDKSMNRIVDSRFFIGVGHNDKVNKEILIIDEEKLLLKSKI